MYKHEEVAVIIFNARFLHTVMHSVRQFHWSLSAYARLQFFAIFYVCLQSTSGYTLKSDNRFDVLKLCDSRSRSP